METRMRYPGDLANKCGCTHKGGETERVEICSVMQKPQTHDIRELQLEDDVVGPVLPAKVAIRGRRKIS